ncbi:hypothetical protein [Sporosarcina sp. FSL W7-1283]|uniref:hypothetical protein n=1 Tax=Sporosarcina sp. FSL W7-1283 TaxID=2921560 RepID=UPI0030FBB7B6
MEWWGVYLHGDRKKRYLSSISKSRAKELSNSLNMRNLDKQDVYFVAMEQRLLTDEKYLGERIY